MTEDLDNQSASSAGTAHLYAGGYGGSLGDSVLGAMGLAGGGAVPLGVAVAASGAVAAASGAHALAAVVSGGSVAAEAVILAEPLDKLLRTAIATLQHPAHFEDVLYAGAFLVALAWAIGRRKT
jgi:hypothetical protein